MDFISNSYARHADNFAEDLTDKSRILISESWLDETTADYWRHARTYECCDCLSNQKASWLTVGDGRWGLDALRIRKKGFENVLASDISEHLLKESKKRGYIKDYAVENAEHLSFADASFDYVFCKESLHHFPQPYLALYEMLRVARQGLFMIEPNDCLCRNPQPHSTAHFSAPVWESVGNYVYTFSRREAEKVAFGLNMPQLVIKGINDHYIQGCEFEPADMKKSKIFSEIVKRIKDGDAKCQDGKKDYDMLMIGFLKKTLDDQSNLLFRDKGWKIIDLPQNPYIDQPSGISIVRKDRVQVILDVFDGVEGKNIGIYGTGEHTDRMLQSYQELFGDLKCKLFFFDSNEARWGQSYHNCLIYSPQEMGKLGLDRCIISSYTYQEDIYNRIKHIEEVGIKVVRIYGQYDPWIF